MSAKVVNCVKEHEGDTATEIHEALCPAAEDLDALSHTLEALGQEGGIAVYSI